MENGKSNLPHRLIYELGHTFASRLDLDDLLGLVVRKCREVFDAEGVSVLLLDPARNEFYFPYFSDLDPKVSARLLEMRFDSSKGVAGSVLRNGRSVRIDSVKHDPNFYSVIDKHTGFQTRSIIAALLMAEDTRLGVIEEVLRGDPSPRYRVRWDDGRESVYTPADGALKAQPRRRRTQQPARSSARSRSGSR